MGNYHIVTIGRQYASGGRAVGEMVAQKLGIPCYHDNILDMAAQKLHVDKEYIMHAEERVTSSLLYNLAMSATAGFVQEKSMPLSEKVFMAESEIIKEIASKGSCVIVGRCARYILKERKNCLNVFIHADLDSRIKRAVTKYEINENEAESILRKNDKRRANFYNVNSGMKWGEKEFYDVCLNSSTLGIEKCASVILSLLAV